MRVGRRMFVAIAPPPTVCDDLAAAIRDLHVGAVPRATTPWHITTAFIGEAPVDSAVSAIAAACADTKSMRLRIDGAGRFGRGRYSVVWAGVGGAVTALHEHVSRLRHDLADRDVQFDDRQYRPHLTLANTSARIDNARSAADLMSLRTYQGPYWIADSCVLYHLDNDAYCPIGQYAFSG